MPTYSKVRYSGVYLVYRGNQRQRGYDIVIQPAGKSDYGGGSANAVAGGDAYLIGVAGLADFATQNAFQSKLKGVSDALTVKTNGFFNPDVTVELSGTGS